MDLDEVEGVVDDAVRERGVLFARSTREGRYVEITLRLSSPSCPDAAARWARISTDGVEAFFIHLPGEIFHPEFDYEREGQIEILRLLVAVAGEYLLGRSQEEELRSFRRRRRYLEIAVDGQTYRPYRFVRWASTRGGKQ